MTALQTARDILAQARAGSTQAEIFLSESDSRTSEWSEGVPENRFFVQAKGVGIRLIDQGRLGFSSANITRSDGVAPVIRQARAALTSVSSDAHLFLPKPASSPPETVPLDLIDSQLRAEDFDARADFLSTLETEVRRRDPRLTKVLRASYREGRSADALVNSNGLEAFEEGTLASFSLACVAVQGAETQVGYGFQAARHYKNLEIQAVIDKTVRQTLALLNGKQVPSGRYDLLLDPWVAAEILDLLAHALRADQVQRGKSFLAGKQTQAIGSPIVTLIDEPRRLRGVGSALFDAEGLPTQNRTLVEKGILQEYLYDHTTAQRAGKASLANATRASYKALPEPGTSNFYIQPGLLSQQDLLRDVKRGLYIHNVMGLHTVDTISGDFSLGIMGEFIENGVCAHGVRGVTMGGNLLDLLMNVDAVGSDLVFAGGMGSPTWRIRDISVGGMG